MSSTTTASSPTSTSAEFNESNSNQGADVVTTSTRTGSPTSRGPQRDAFQPVASDIVVHRYPSAVVLETHLQLRKHWLLLSDPKAGLLDDSLRITAHDSNPAASFPEEELRAKEVLTCRGCAGAIRLLGGWYLLVVSRCSLVGRGRFLGHEIFSVDEITVVPIPRKAALDDEETQLELNYVAQLTNFLDHSNFYISYTYDLTRSRQKVHQCGQSGQTGRKVPLVSPRAPECTLRECVWERADPRFIWNWELIRPFRAKAHLIPWALPLLDGYVSIREVVIPRELVIVAGVAPTTEEMSLRSNGVIDREDVVDGDSIADAEDRRRSSCTIPLDENGMSRLLYVLISRRCTRRAGARYHMRGADLLGNVANFVETEQMLVTSSGIVSSFVQIRGSVPLFWTQHVSSGIKPKPVITTNTFTRGAYEKHMNDMISRYGGVSMVSLIDKTGGEAELGEAFETQALLFNGGGAIKYCAFDFHTECRRNNYDNLHGKLLRDVAPELDAFGFFLRHGDGDAVHSQGGVFRVNCIDCLDRTNVVQSVFARHILKTQFSELGIHPDAVFDPDFVSTFQNIWADNADAMSRQYAGTGALKTDYTRTGKRSVQGILSDVSRSARRLFQQTFGDDSRQESIHLFLRRFSLERQMAVIQGIGGGSDDHTSAKKSSMRVSWSSGNILSSDGGLVGDDDEEGDDGILTRGLSKSTLHQYHTVIRMRASLVNKSGGNSIDDDQSRRVPVLLDVMAEDDVVVPGASVEDQSQSRRHRGIFSIYFIESAKMKRYPLQGIGKISQSLQNHSLLSITFGRSPNAKRFEFASALGREQFVGTIVPLLPFGNIVDRQYSPTSSSSSSSSSSTVSSSSSPSPSSSSSTEGDDATTPPSTPSSFPLGVCMYSWNLDLFSHQPTLVHLNEWAPPSEWSATAAATSTSEGDARSLLGADLIVVAVQNCRYEVIGAPLGDCDRSGDLANKSRAPGSAKKRRKRGWKLRKQSSRPPTTIIASEEMTSPQTNDLFTDADGDSEDGDLERDGDDVDVDDDIDHDQSDDDDDNNEDDDGCNSSEGSRHSSPNSNLLQRRAKHVQNLTSVSHFVYMTQVHFGDEYDLLGTSHEADCVLVVLSRKFYRPFLGNIISFPVTQEEIGPPLSSPQSLQDRAPTPPPRSSKAGQPASPRTPLHPRTSEPSSQSSSSGGDGISAAAAAVGGGLKKVASNLGWFGRSITTSLSSASLSLTGVSSGVSNAVGVSSPAEVSVANPGSALSPRFSVAAGAYCGTAIGVSCHRTSMLFLSVNEYSSATVLLRVEGIELSSSFHHQFVLSSTQLLSPIIEGKAPSSPPPNHHTSLGLPAVFDAKSWTALGATEQSIAVAPLTTDGRDVVVPPCDGGGDGLSCFWRSPFEYPLTTRPCQCGGDGDRSIPSIPYRFVDVNVEPVRVDASSLSSGQQRSLRFADLCVIDLDGLFVECFVRFSAPFASRSAISEYTEQTPADDHGSIHWPGVQMESHVADLAFLKREHVVAEVWKDDGLNDVIAGVALIPLVDACHTKPAAFRVNFCWREATVGFISGRVQIVRADDAWA